MGVLLQAFFFGPGRVSGVPSPLDGDAAIPFWWDHLAAQANALAKSGFTAVWLPPPLIGASGGFSSGYDVFDDYGLSSKSQKGTVPTRYGTRAQLQRCAAMMRANGIDVYVDLDSVLDSALLPDYAVTGKVKCYFKSPAGAVLAFDPEA